MDISTASGARFAAHTSLTIAALAVIGCVANDQPSEQRVASLNATPASECTSHGSGHTLLLEGVDGEPFQLVLYRGSGWKYVAGARSDGGERNAALRNGMFSPIATAQAETTAAPIDDPMVVFIDGPTGYTFAWSPENEWTLVGRIINETRK